MNQRDDIAKTIEDGRCCLGIELGSTRIKAVLIGADCAPLASGAHDWENRLENGVWTYALADVWAGVQDAYAKLAADTRARYGVGLRSVSALGVSAMMHGYLVLGADGEALVPFRTWRNTLTERAAAALTKEFDFNIPQRWSIAHLWEAILNEEEHLPRIDYMTTLAGYVHWRLTGCRVAGVGEASGMFPIDSATGDYHAGMMEKFDRLADQKNFPKKLADILPRVMAAGERAGTLTDEGARLLDPSGGLQPGAPLCPPEGDAGTGMVATNSVAPRTGNVSAGTSIFAMVVLEKALSRIYTEIDVVTTPDGRPVAMVHCNNCTSDLDAWVKLFAQLLAAFGADVPKHELYDKLYFAALEGAPDGGGLLSYNYYSGEPITGLEEGRPLFARLPDAKLTLENFMRSTLYSAMATLKIGMDILMGREGVQLEALLGHGGLFKTEGVGQRLMASALGVDVAVMESAGEGGPWGIALLAAYMARRQADESLGDFLARRVFAGARRDTAAPNAQDAAGFARFMKLYTDGLPIQRAAVKTMR